MANRQLAKSLIVVSILVSPMTGKHCAMKSGSMTVKQVKGILSRIKDDDLRKELAKVFRSEIVGSSRKVRPVSDVGRLRR